jgi:hypothetical protein
MKKYRMYFMNINSGAEFSIDVDNSDEILHALKQKPQYVREPDNWECFDQEEIKDEAPRESYTAFLYEDDGITAADLSTYDNVKAAIDFAMDESWDEVVNDNTGGVVWRK